MPSSFYLINPSLKKAKQQKNITLTLEINKYLPLVAAEETRSHLNFHIKDPVGIALSFANKYTRLA